MVATVAVAGIAAPLAITAGLSALGFGAAGVGAGTWAAATQAGLGNVVAGTWFAGKPYLLNYHPFTLKSFFSCSKCRSCRYGCNNCSSDRNRSGNFGWSNLIPFKCFSGYFWSYNILNDHWNFGIGYCYDYSDTYLNSDCTTCTICITFSVKLFDKIKRINYLCML